MTKIYVIAGNHNEAYAWINRKIAERISQGETLNKIGDYVYVDSPNRLRGLANPSGVFIGTWRDRPDILEIVECLVHHSNNSDRLREIHNQLYYEHHKRTAVK
jgi:hypothetical protein